MGSYVHPSLDEYWISKTLDLANEAFHRGEVPVGAILLDSEGVVLSTASNRMEELKDPSGHAEMLAMRAATQKLQNWRLDECTLYVSLEPCPMCAGAILLSRVRRVVYAATDFRLGACGGSSWDILNENPIDRVIEVKKGVLEGQSVYLLKSFFKKLRKRNKDRKKFNKEIDDSNTNL
jgi:tRNA(adenine34) deaminase